MITFQYEAYGTYARASYCADFLELLALTGAAPHWGDYDDYLENVGVPLREVFRGGFVEEAALAGADPVSDPIRPITYVRNILDERLSSLGRNYPFRITNERLQFSGDVNNSTYIGLLAICQLHVMNDRVALTSELAFETSVHDALVRVGLISAVVGTSGGGGFNASLDSACQTLGLVANPDGVKHPKRARDEDIDVICRFNFNDDRRGQWLLIGQSTCAKSDDWQKKSKEPSRSAWATYVSSWPLPQIFLAVPHHVQSDTLAFLLDHIEEGFVVDRIRLSAMRPEPNPQERTAVGRLLEIGVERPE